MLDLDAVRARFPALRRTIDSRPVAYLDGPGGTQVPAQVIDAMSAPLRSGVSNWSTDFPSGQLAVDIVTDARRAVADLYNAESPEEIVFGPNMTTLVFSFSRALAQTWSEGDAIVVTNLDHDANREPWIRAARDRGVDVRVWDFRPDTCTLHLHDLDELLDEKVKLVAVTKASNAVGTIVDIASVVERAHLVGALVFVDAVHYAPHGLIDVRAWGCDALVSSPYKWFGPHAGALWARYDLLDALPAYKVRPAPAVPPGKFETGTASFETLAGVSAAVHYLESLGEGASRRDRLASAFAATGTHEAELADRFLTGVAELGGVELHGPDSPVGRTATFAVDVKGHAAAEVSEELGRAGLFVWAGHYYAVAVMERLGVLDSGGLVRIGFVHYNTPGEVDRVLSALDHL